jgi:ABC-2 type transport system ATP-binding protein
MEQAEQLCEHVCIIAGGRKVLDGSLRDIRRANLGTRYSIAFEAASVAADAVMRDGRGLFEQVVRDGEGWLADLASGVSVHQALNALNALDVPLASFTRVQPSLHEIFVQQVGRASTPLRRPEGAHV